ncbi:hypothetical protein L226DRAFT_566488 [Lentinus tigrinus ALCF2SS1-7]|uniref:Uncharacterized protein n=1 Tax=Lentinus tigrinus ALCF2SS1-6 TaxID=1328759 RepID=A0A5C2SZB1_9APHY|nr:hypothetical protein L227DRAFT_559605 [Lentinus tigrinus ALCF2SS1-6]RPD79944.1 hypothetical protein L226DRAFT_566488 [Lentinus tigrinus ALCF2SS1-7]
MDAAHLDCLLHDLPARSYPAPVLPPPPPTMHNHRSSFYPSDWRPQAPQSSFFAGALAPSSWTNAGPSHAPSLWPNGPPEFLLPFHHYSTRDYDAAGYSLARSDTSSAVSRDSDLSPSPEVAEVVCNAPLVAPIPLPYHSPTFLLYDLPDDDEDLSHPPYTHRPHKRKRARDEDDENADAHDAHPVPAKRRSIAEGSQHWSSSAGQWGSSAAPLSLAPVTALRHPATAFSRRNRAR